MTIDFQHSSIPVFSTVTMCQKMFLDDEFVFDTGLRDNFFFDTWTSYCCNRSNCACSSSAKVLKESSACFIH